jgi:hypothetical protein
LIAWYLFTRTVPRLTAHLATLSKHANPDEHGTTTAQEIYAHIASIVFAIIGVILVIVGTGVFFDGMADAASGHQVSALCSSMTDDMHSWVALVAQYTTEADIAACAPEHLEAALEGPVNAVYGAWLFVLGLLL